MRCMPNNAMYLAGCCILWIAVQTVFVQFVHYDSQYRLLDPRHYNVDLITQEDYQQLSNPENRVVHLSNGNTKTKAGIWDSHVLPKYKPVNDGSHYVLVTVKGTAPFIRQWYSGVLPIFVVCLLVFFFGIKGTRQGTKEHDSAAAGD